MTPVTFFFVGMLLLYAVTSGKALAIWNAITGGGSSGSSGTSTPPPVQTPGFDAPGGTQVG